MITVEKLRRFGSETAVYWRRLQAAEALDDAELLCSALAACYHLAVERNGAPPRMLVQRMTSFLQSLADNDSPQNRAELVQLESVLAPLHKG